MVPRGLPRPYETVFVIEINCESGGKHGHHKYDAENTTPENMTPENTTPDTKDPSQTTWRELPKQYDPFAVEDRWVTRWAQHPFGADPHSSKPPFCVVIPPPNVTGNLHLGHAFDNTIIDTLVRYKRMKGFEALFQPGTDHAGISTQVQVERALAAEGKTKYDLGREAFLERVWDWKERYGGIILTQLQRSRGISRLVADAFHHG